MPLEMLKSLPWEIIGQIIGIIAPILTVVSYQLNTKKSVLIALTGATVATCVCYFLLGATSGFVLNVACLLRNLFCFFFKERSKGSYIVAAIFAVIMCVLGAFSWQGPHSLLIIVGLAINTVFVAVGDPQWLRKSILLTSSLVLIYNLIEFSVGGIANEALAIGSSVVGIIRFRKGIKK